MKKHVLGCCSFYKFLYQFAEWGKKGTMQHKTLWNGERGISDSKCDCGGIYSTFFPYPLQYLTYTIQIKIYGRGLFHINN